MHCFQENLQCDSKLANIGNLPTYNANAYAITTTNLKPLVKEALNGPDQIHWHKAIRVEMNGLESMNIWETVDRPEGVNLVDFKLVLQVKMDANNIPYKFKSRFCACGFSQREGIDYNEIFTPVIPRDAIRTLLVIATRFDWELDLINVMQAYLNTELHHHIYLKLPEDQVDLVKGEIICKWKITDNRPVMEFLKIKIMQDWIKQMIDLDQWVYIQNIIREWNQLHEKTWIPMTRTLLKAPPDSTIDKRLRTKYPTLIGKLLWIANMVRPDTSFAVNALVCHMSRPTEEAMQAALWVIMYLNQMQDEVLRLGGRDGTKPAITTYTDSNWASDLNAD
ncbi:hypothetical protein NDA14_007782 [Ustilago hordei]|nr:hypothetical protein NDA14_007782 [Ustilago hordei]